MKDLTQEQFNELVSAPEDWQYISSTLSWNDTWVNKKTGKSLPASKETKMMVEYIKKYIKSIKK